MVSKYFKLKTSSENFKKETKNLIESLKYKRILIYGAGEAFSVFEREYGLTKNLNVIAVADKKFNKTHQKEFNGIKAVTTQQIIREDFDYILITNEQCKAIVNFLDTDLGVEPDKIKTIFNEKIKDAAANVNYLYNYHFDKTLPKLLKKLKNKKVILYGAGSFLEVIKEYFDISKLNVIGISDKNYAKQNTVKEFLGYKTLPPQEICKYEPDFVLVTTKFYVQIIEDLHDKFLKKTKIKIKPLLKKTFIAIYREIRDMKKL